MLVSPSAEIFVIDCVVNKVSDDWVSDVGVDSRESSVALKAVAHQSHQEVLVGAVVVADQRSSSLSPAGVLSLHSSSTHLARLRSPVEDSLLLKLFFQPLTTLLTKTGLRDSMYEC